MNPVSKILLLFIFCSIYQLKAQIVKVTDLISPSVVSLKVETDDGSYTGTGFFVDSSGVIATNYHVVSGARKIIAKTKDGVNLFCKGVLSVDKDKDLALLKFAVKNQPSLKLADSLKIRRGESIVVVGNPKGLEQTVSNGIVSALREKNNWHTVQITAPISKGSSGSPVVNLKGEVLGVVTFNVVDSQNLNFASSVKHLAVMVKSIENLEMVSLEEAFPKARIKATPTPKKITTIPKNTEKASKTLSKLDLLDEFWREYWNSMNVNNSALHLKHYSNIVDYQYIKGKATKTQIEKGLSEFYRKFPNRVYTLVDKPVIIPLDKGSSNRYGFDFSFTYRYHGSKQASGKAFVELALQYTSQGWKIYKFRERVEKK